MTPTESIALDLIRGASKNNPVTRYDLRQALHITDRNCREVIGRLREQGYRIVGTSNDNGYFIAETESDYSAFRLNYIAKATTIMKRVAAMDRRVEGQISING